MDYVYKVECAVAAWRRGEITTTELARKIRAVVREYEIEHLEELKKLVSAEG